MNIFIVLLLTKIFSTIKSIVSYNIGEIKTFIENLGDLLRLKIFFENIEDNKLCETLEKERKTGRNDYQIRTMLNLIYEMKIFGHRSVESFRRELSRNSQLRIVCGLSEGKYKYLNNRKHLIPPSRVFTSFLNKLKKHQKELDIIFEELVKFMYENLEGFGEECAVDGKYLDTYAQQFHKNKCNDNRAEHDAKPSCKTYFMKDGTTKKEWHFGFRAHILCDANYGLPIEYKLTPANNSKQKELDKMLENMNYNNKYKLDNMKILLADAGYENSKRNKKLEEEYNITPLVDIKHMWRKDENIER